MPLLGVQVIIENPRQFFFEFLRIHNWNSEGRPRPSGLMKSATTCRRLRG